MKGQYNHTIDAKGRFFIPSRLKDELGTNFVITKGLDECLFVYSAANFKELEEKISAMPMSKSRDLQRFFFSSATDVSVDSQGRGLISQNLRTYASLSKEITIIGVLNRAEIWDSERWNEYSSNVQSQQVAKAMEDIGF